MTTPRFSTVLFDLDGTLANTIPLIVASYRHALSSHGLPVPEEPELRGWIGRTVVDIFTERHPEQAESIVAEYTRWNVAHLSALVETYPGIAELLADLASAGVRIGVATSKRRFSAEATLAAVGLDGLVRVAAAMEDTVLHKPAPEPLLHALDVFGSDPAAAAYIGDAAVDLHAAHAAGVAGVGVTWGAGTPVELEAVPHAAVVASVDDLRAFLLPPE